MSEWISVKDRLPSMVGAGFRSESVLVTRDCGEGSTPSIVVTFAWGNGFSEENGQWYEQEEKGYRVTHWMPLPEPPEA